MRRVLLASTVITVDAQPNHGRTSRKRVLAAWLAITVAISLLPQPVAARHSDGLSPIVPWHHERGVKVTAGTSNDFGSRWGGCTDRLARAAARNLDVVVAVDGVALPAAGWTAPIRPAKRISPVRFRKRCRGKPDNRSGSWVFWNTPHTFEEPGTHRVRVTMTAKKRIGDGAGEVVPAGWTISEEMRVRVVEPPQAGSFTLAGSLSQARTAHSATLLADGRVLVTGGDGFEPADLESAEVWDSETSTFGPADAFVEPILESDVEADVGRTGHTATLLPDGRYLVVGGSRSDDPRAIAEAEVLDPATGELAPAGSLAEARFGHTATFLRDGRVLVVGGTVANGPLASAEIWTSAAKPARCFGKRPTLIAQSGVELVGTSGSDVIAGSVGADRILSGGGNDRICGYGGDDVIDGGGGNDTIDGGAGADMVTGAGGNDRLVGSGGDDTLNGGKGRDTCVGGGGTDWLPGCNDKKQTRGTVVVNKNLKLNGPHTGRFIIGKDGVTLDCGGHTVTGAGRDVTVGGVQIVGRKNVSIRNCHLRDHFFGVLLVDSNRNVLSRNRMTHVGDGFNLVRSDANKLLQNAVTDASYSGVALFEGSDKNRIVGNVVADLADIGFTLQSNSSRNRVTGNSASRAGNSGFLVHHSGAGNAFSGNSATDNTGFGFSDNTTGFRGDAGTDNTYAENTCAGNSFGDSSPQTLCD